MNISVHKLLDKIGAELIVAKNATSEASIRERTQAIKAICELILEESVTASSSPVTTPYVPAPIQTVTVPQQKKLVMDNEANGDSLFDF